MPGRAPIVLALALGCLLGGCRSPEQRAANAAARADFYASSGNMRMASIEMGRAVRLDEDQPAYWNALARYDLQIGDVRGAYLAYSRVYELQRDNVEALEWLAELSVSANDFSQAQTYIDSLLVLQPNDPRGRVAQGQMALKQAHYDEAMKIADAVLASDPQAGDAAVLKSNALEKLGKPAEAAAMLEGRIGKEGPGVGSMLQRLLDLYTTAGDHAAAARTLARLHALDPGNVATEISYAQAVSQAGDRAGALRLAADLQDHHGDDSDAQLAALGILRTWSGDGVARAAAVQAAGRHPATAGAMANFLVGDGAPAAARDLVRPLVAGQAVTAANIEAQVAYAAALRALGAGGQARGVLDAVLDFDHTNVPALTLRTEIELASHDLDRALADARIAVDASPQSPGPQLLLARVYAVQGNMLMARNTYATALNNFPADPQVLGTYVGWLQHVGGTGLAMAVTSSFTRANPKVQGGWVVLRNLCSAVHDGSCVTYASGVLSGKVTPPKPSGDAAA